MLASANNLAYFWDKNVHCGHGSSIRVQLHIKGLYFFRVICHNNWPLEDTVRKIPFMLRLQIQPPCNGKFKLFFSIPQFLYSISIGNMHARHVSKSGKLCKRNVSVLILKE